MPRRDRPGAALDANYTDALLLRARTLETLKRLDEAADVLRSARSLSPEDPDVHQALGNVVLAGGDPAEALEALREARRISPVQHHNRDKILDAFARRMPPFRQADALARRDRRLPLFKRWAVAAALTTALILLFVLTRTAHGRPSMATILAYIITANVLVFVQSARDYATIVTRFARAGSSTSPGPKP